MSVSRRSIYNFSPTQRQYLVNLMLQYITDEVVFYHRNNSDVLHGTDQFFSLHRQYLRGMENFLSANGGEMFDPLPYWNPTQRIPDEFFPIVKQSPADPFPRPPLENQGPMEFEIPSDYVFPG